MARDKTLMDWRTDPIRDISFWHKMCSATIEIENSHIKFSNGIGLYLDNEQSGVCWNCVRPFDLSGSLYNRFIRYIAAVANNIVMTHGGNLLRIKAEDQDFRAILSELNNRYNQVFEVFMKLYPGRQHYVIPFDGTYQAESSRKPERHYHELIPRNPSNNFFVGLDIGNSWAKISVLLGDKVVYLNQIPSQISELILSGPFEYFKTIVNKVKLLLARHIPAIAKIDAVGISWFGDVIRGIPQTQAADLAPWKESKWEKELHGLKAMLESAFGCPLYFHGDSESLARYIGMWRGMPQTYLLILGTSTGGACFLSDGSYQNGVNLVSRIIIDLEDGAPRHSSTGAPGTLQQYSASYGIAKIFKLYSSPDNQIISQNREDGAYLSYLLSHSKPELVEYAKNCVDRLASWILPAIVDLQTHYIFNQLVLSGGNVRAPLGQSLVDSFQKKWQQSGRRPLRVHLLSDKTGWPPSHEISISAAKLASKLFAYGS